jgi:ubiquinone/menaquinone biosynthesis C-methylase UbiE
LRLIGFHWGDECLLGLHQRPAVFSLDEKQRRKMVGVDISKTFVRIANENAQKAGLDIAFEEGDAADLPLPSDGFDFAVCTAAFKNFTRPLDALNETYRVLKPGGTALDGRRGAY